MAASLLGDATQSKSGSRIGYRRYTCTALVGRTLSCSVGWNGARALGRLHPLSQLRDLYARATCAIFPATPIPLLQAKCSVRLATTLLHGVPVVASAVGEHLNYGAEGAAYLVPADATPAEFAQAVVELLHNPTRQTLARRQSTERLVTRFAWSRLTAPLPDFYESLLRQG